MIVLYYIPVMQLGEKFSQLVMSKASSSTYPAAFHHSSILLLKTTVPQVLDRVRPDRKGRVSYHPEGREGERDWTA